MHTVQCAISVQSQLSSKLELRTLRKCGSLPSSLRVQADILGLADQGTELEHVFK